MSAIGITVVENKRITESFGTLINPETYFNSFNIELTGISPEMVQEAPNFAEFWKKAEPLMNSGILVAHSAAFDMGVLSKCLRAYGIKWKQYVKYACTVIMSRSLVSETENHRLNTLCDYFNIPLNHHRADSDSLAAAEILLRLFDIGLDVSGFIRTYDLSQVKTVHR